MAIDFKKTFGADNSIARWTGTDRKDLPKAQFWLNFGYFVNEGTDDERFVSLPTGIPLDTMDKVNAKSSNQDWAQFQAARNDLLDQFINLCADLNPGDSHVIRCEGGLSIQIRRISEEAAEPAADESNVYARPGLFSIAGGKAA